jgi:hypothetical protein
MKTLSAVARDYSRVRALINGDVVTSDLLQTCHGSPEWGSKLLFPLTSV